MTATTKPRALPVVPEGIPAELRARRQWVPWDYEERGGEWTKVPLDANRHFRRRASATDPATWVDFEAALAYHEARGTAGVGYVLTADDPYCGVDLDGCRDPLTGALADAAASLVAELSTYAEVSPGGRGVKLWLQGRLPTDKGRKRPDLGIEVYDRARWFAATGRRLAESPREPRERQAALDALYARLWPAEGAAKANGNGHRAGGIPPDDQAVIARAERARNGARFAALWRGETAGNHDDDSGADLALCNLLAFWVGPDPHRIDRLFRLSGLYRRKWEREDYRRRTIDKALAGRTAYYDWGRDDGDDGAAFAAEDDEPEATGGADDKLPTLDAGDQHLPRITALAWDALNRANDPPRLFRFGGRASRLERDADGLPALVSITDDRMRHELARAANWRRGHGQKIVPAMPPLAVVRDVLASPEPALPPLDMVTTVPTFAADGTLAGVPGYHPSGRSYYAPVTGFALPPIADCPNATDIARARALICDDLLGDFPFTGDAELAHAAGLLILPFVRALIDGPTPLHLIEKPMPGTGASLLADVLLYPAIGHPLAALIEGRDEDEWRKRITAKLRGGATAVLIDNLRQRLESASLAAALTLTTWEDRLLGTLETVRLPVRCAWIATGNNPALSSEIARRAIRIRLDAHADKPWLGRTFRHPQLRDWVRGARADLAWAALTLGRAWLVDGKPIRAGAPTLGMYESWSRAIGGILDTAEIPGFLTNLDELYDRSDAEGRALRAFVSGWWERFAATSVGVADLFGLVIAEGHDLDLGERGERSQRIRLGVLLGQLRDRQYITDDGTTVRLAAAGVARRLQRWQLIPVETRGN